MSIAQEPTIFPCDLLTHWPAQQESNEGVWWVVYTRSRHEKAVATELWRYEIPFYLPLISNDRAINGRQRPGFVPLFAGYVFGTDNELLIALKSNRISRILPVANQDQIRRDLYQISRLIAIDAPLRIERRLCSGQTARIKTGIFRDLEGTIFNDDGRRRLLVAIDFLKTGVSFEFDGAMVELK